MNRRDEHLPPQADPAEVPFEIAAEIDDLRLIESAQLPPRARLAAMMLASSLHLLRRIADYIRTPPSTPSRRMT